MYKCTALPTFLNDANKVIVAHDVPEFGWRGTKNRPQDFVRYSCASVLLVALAGCSGSLHVFDKDQTEIKGVPFRAAEIYIKKGTRNKSTKGEDCDPVQFVQTVSLPTGAQYYVSVYTAPLAKTGFVAKFHDSGALMEVSLNTEPAGADNIRAVNELAKTLLPVTGLAPPAPAPGPPGKPACDAGEESVTFTKFES